MLSLKNVKSPDSNFVNFPKVGAYGDYPLEEARKIVDSLENTIF